MKTKKEEVTVGVKGFDKDLKCRGFQYEEGETYKTGKKPIRCTENGFHFCENPIDVFGYYPPSNSRYHAVEGFGEKSTDESDSKIAVSKIKIGAAISLFDMIKLGVECILKRVNFKDAAATNTGDRSAATNTGDRSAATNTGSRSAATNTGDQSAATNTGYQSAATNTGDQSAATNTGDQSAATNTGYQSAATNTGYQSAATNTGYQSAATNTGYQSAATNTGYQSAATNTGDQSAATNTGYQSAASVEGKESIACGLGIENKAKASLGSWIVLTEWGQGDNGGWHIKSLKSAKIDGRKLKADVWYELKNGKFVEVK
jgi:hypothetical protein